jgi:hypothetical protein
LWAGGYLSGLAERRACHFAPSFIVAILGIEAAAMSEERPPEGFERRGGNIVGGLFPRIVLVGACLGLVAALGPIFGLAQQVGRASQVSTAVGIDADPTGNSATSLGQIDACVSVGAGQTFDVDIFVTDVADLKGWQGILTYDPKVVNVANADVELFLAGTEAGRTINLSEPVPDKDGSYLLVIADMTPGAGHSGSGVLARVTLQVVGTGTSFLTLDKNVLGDSTANAIGPMTSDGWFDGPVGYAQVWVDEPCPGSLPTPTPSPAPTPQATASPAAPSPTPATVEPASPVATTPSGQSTEGEGEGGFPWAVAGGAAGAAVVDALAAGLAFRRLQRRAS